MSHEVRPLGEQERRRNTTLRVWVPTRELLTRLPKSAVQSQEHLQQELCQMGWWKFWRLSERDWIAARCRKGRVQHTQHFHYATSQLEREEAREGRVIWQCGPKFDYKTSTVLEGTIPSSGMKQEVQKVLQELPFSKVVWAQSIYNEYHRRNIRATATMPGGEQRTDQGKPPQQVPSTQRDPHRSQRGAERWGYKGWWQWPRWGTGRWEVHQEVGWGPHWWWRRPSWRYWGA